MAHPCHGPWRAALVAAALAATAHPTRADDPPPGPCTRATADRTTTTTSACTACHTSARVAREGFFVMPGHEFGHPVDVDYDAAQASRGGALVPRARLPRFVTLVDGRITCVTCHAGGTGFRGSTAADPERGLCLACHSFDGARWP